MPLPEEWVFLALFPKGLAVLFMAFVGTDKLAPNLPVFLSHDSIKNVSAPSIPT